MNLKDPTCSQPTFDNDIETLSKRLRTVSKLVPMEKIMSLAREIMERVSPVAPGSAKMGYLTAESSGRPTGF